MNGKLKNLNVPDILRFKRSFSSTNDGIIIYTKNCNQSNKIQENTVKGEMEHKCGKSICFIS